ncbi:carboxymuconolactone decarboxylase family protein [Marmoricola sp. RAF53]|uniref:carboxymuconolactone decarboxylase family protein n=1 Tax=Marmoricola sp. RAF53 TaxID=3233059 RepID=UPI003F975341
MSTAEALGLFAAVAGIPAPDLTDPAVAELAAQFTLDVSAVDDGQRAAFFAATGDQAFPVVQRIYAHDFVPRVRAVLGAVLPGVALPEAVPHDGDAWPLLEEFMVTVARLRALDPTVTELVRLRGARLHDCAVCRSRRSQDAIDAGAGEAEFAAVDAWATSTLPGPAKAALALTDALVLTPDDVPAAAAAAARAHLTEDQVVEVVLDVMRNAANKIAVALGADAATVTDGVELFTTDADGNLAVVGTA